MAKNLNYFCHYYNPRYPLSVLSSTLIPMSSILNKSPGKYMLLLLSKGCTSNSFFNRDTRAEAMQTLSVLPCPACVLSGFLSQSKDLQVRLMLIYLLMCDR